MARSGVIRDTADSLRRFLAGRLRSQAGRPARIHTGPPVRSVTAGAPPCVSLYLYRIEENRDLYRPEKVLESAAGSRGAIDALYRNPPIYLRLRYAVLAWGRDSKEEHYLLGQILGVLMDGPNLLAGGEARGESFRRGDRITLRLTHPFDLSEQQEILRSLGLHLRPVLSLTATVRLDS